MGAPVQNPNDGTQLGTSEVISDEYIDPTEQSVRREPLLPVTGYKLPRSKIAVGPYGQDWGDAVADQPLQTESRAERQALEIASLRERMWAQQSLQIGYAERLYSADARGHDISTRGVR